MGVKHGILGHVVVETEFPGRFVPLGIGDLRGQEKRWTVGDPYGLKAAGRRIGGHPQIARMTALVLLVAGIPQPRGPSQSVVDLVCCVEKGCGALIGEALVNEAHPERRPENEVRQPHDEIAVDLLVQQVNAGDVLERPVARGRQARLVRPDSRLGGFLHEGLDGGLRREVGIGQKVPLVIPVGGQVGEIHGREAVIEFETEIAVAAVAVALRIDWVHSCRIG